jgi:hypothetical protein
MEWERPYICSNHEQKQITHALDADNRSLLDHYTSGTLRILPLGFIEGVEDPTGVALVSMPPHPDLKNKSQNASVSLPFELHSSPLQSPFSLFALN